MIATSFLPKLAIGILCDGRCKPEMIRSIYSAENGGLLGRAQGWDGISQDRERSLPTTRGLFMQFQKQLLDKVSEPTRLAEGKHQSSPSAQYWSRESLQVVLEPTL